MRSDADAEAMAVFIPGLLRGIALQMISPSAPSQVGAIIDGAGHATWLTLRP